MNILVVDDSPANLTLSREALQDEFKVSLVPSGIQALKFVEKKKPDVVLLDLMMPEMDGIETLKRLKAMEGFDAKVIIVTGTLEKETEDECRRLGADDFVLKPFNTVKLKQQIKELFNI